MLSDLILFSIWNYTLSYKRYDIYQFDLFHLRVYLQSIKKNFFAWFPTNIYIQNSLSYDYFFVIMINLRRVHILITGVYQANEQFYLHRILKENTFDI